MTESYRNRPRAARRLEPGRCNECGEVKPRTLEFFPKSPGKKDGMAGKCRTCTVARSLAWAVANRERIAARRRERYAGDPVYRERVKAEGRERSKAKRGFIPLTEDEKRERKRAANRRRYHQNAGVRLMERVRSRTSKALGGKIGDKLSGRWLGCTRVELVAHIEAQFQPGMTWENRGAWHVDHRRPLNTFDLTDREQVLAACHYTNLRPLWAADNLRRPRDGSDLIAA